jgi:hypothetical protein
LRTICARRQLDLMTARAQKAGKIAATNGRVIDRTRHAVQVALAAKQGRFYRRLADARGSKRAIRDDGAGNLESVLVAMVTHASEAGAIFDSRGNAQRWWTFEDLSRRAFGEFVPGELGPSRIKRWARVLRRAGFLIVHQRMARDPMTGEDKPISAVKLLSSHFFALLGFDELANRAHRNMVNAITMRKAPQRAPAREAAPVAQTPADPRAAGSSAPADDVFAAMPRTLAPVACIDLITSMLGEITN